MVVVMMNLICYLDGIWNQLRDKPPHRCRGVFLEGINWQKRLHLRVDRIFSWGTQSQRDPRSKQPGLPHCPFCWRGGSVASLADAIVPCDIRLQLLWLSNVDWKSATLHQSSRPPGPDQDQRGIQLRGLSCYQVLSFSSCRRLLLGHLGPII